MKVIRKHEVEQFRAPSTFFKGEVWVKLLVDASEPGGIGAYFMAPSSGARGR